MQSRNARTIGIVWYERDTYAEVRGVMEDAQVLPREYETWLRTAQSVIHLEHARGSDIVKVPINSDAFIAWCRATGQRADARARTRHVNLAIEDFCNGSTWPESEEPSAVEPPAAPVEKPLDVSNGNGSGAPVLPPDSQPDPPLAPSQ